MNALVRILNSNSDFDKAYTYIIPSELVSSVNVGVFVDVPFAGRKKTDVGLVTGVFQGDDFFVNKKGVKMPLKKIISISEKYFPLDENRLKLADFISKRYVCSPAAAVGCMVVPKVTGKTNVKCLKLLLTPEKTFEITNSNEIKSIRQIRVLEALAGSENHILSENELKNSYDANSSVFSALVKKGFAEKIIVEADENYEENTAETVALEEDFQLNREQQAAFDKLSELSAKDEYNEVLLKGVTGSGKTEVYFHIIKKILAEGGGIIVLVPEIALTSQMIKRMRARLGNNVAVLHSRLSEKEKSRQFANIISGKSRVVLGPRSAVFAPVKNLKLIIADEEQEPSYKSFESMPFYNACDVAALRMHIEKGMVVYGSATPRATTYYRAKSGKSTLLALNSRAKNSELPEVSVVDMRDENLEEGSVISKRLYNALKNNAEAGRQSVIFVPRRGYSGRIICLHCGKNIMCPHCSVPMSYHRQAKRLICHYCGSTVVVPEVCPCCGSEALSSKSYGTEMVEGELKKLFPDKEVIRMDTDTVQEKGGHAKLLEHFEKENVPFLVGTQMIAKGLDFPNITLVGVIGAEALLNIQEYNARERAFVLITQVFGRAGRSSLSGRGILQTLQPKDEIYELCRKQDYEKFVEKELEYRERLLYPPFATLATVTVSGTDDKKASDFIGAVRNILYEMSVNTENIEKHIEVFKAARCSVPKVNNRFRWGLMLKTMEPKIMIDLMNCFARGPLEQMKSNTGGDLRVFIDIDY